MKKIGTLKGIPVVEGDANLVKDQILYKETNKGISLSKRTNGKLEEVSGGNSGNASGDNEILYYKIIENNDEVILDGNPTGMTYSDFVSHIYQVMLAYAAKYISIKAIYEDKYIEINEAANVTGSQEYKNGSLLPIIIEYGNNKTLKGFSIYSEKFTFLELSSNTLMETPKGDLYVKVEAFLTKNFPNGQIEEYIKVFKKVIIPISKEEYYNL